jgi:hypothetical protein
LNTSTLSGSYIRRPMTMGEIDAFARGYHAEDYHLDVRRLMAWGVAHMMAPGERRRILPKELFFGGVEQLRRKPFLCSLVNKPMAYSSGGLVYRPTVSLACVGRRQRCKVKHRYGSGRRTAAPAEAVAGSWGARSREAAPLLLEKVWLPTKFSGTQEASRPPNGYSFASSKSLSVSRSFLSCRLASISKRDSASPKKPPGSTS